MKRQNEVNKPEATAQGNLDRGEAAQAAPEIPRPSARAQMLVGDSQTAMATANAQAASAQAANTQAMSAFLIWNLIRGQGAIPNNSADTKDYEQNKGPNKKYM